MELLVERVVALELVSGAVLKCAHFLLGLGLLACRLEDLVEDVIIGVCQRMSLLLLLVTRLGLLLVGFGCPNFVKLSVVNSIGVGVSRSEVERFRIFGVSFLVLLLLVIGHIAHEVISEVKVVVLSSGVNWLRVVVALLILIVVA